MNRRGFIKGIGLALIAAPAVIRTPGILMPIRPFEDGGYITETYRGRTTRVYFDVQSIRDRNVLVNHELEQRMATLDVRRVSWHDHWERIAEALMPDRSEFEVMPAPDPRVLVDL